MYKNRCVRLKHCYRHWPLHPSEETGPNQTSTLSLPSRRPSVPVLSCSSVVLVCQSAWESVSNISPTHSVFPQKHMTVPLRYVLCFLVWLELWATLLDTAPHGFLQYCSVWLASMSFQDTGRSTCIMNTEDRQRAPSVFICISGIKPKQALNQLCGDFHHTYLFKITNPRKVHIGPWACVLESALIWSIACILTAVLPYKLVKFSDVCSFFCAVYACTDCWSWLCHKIWG